jgi:hypothetical protein
MGLIWSTPAEEDIVKKKKVSWGGASLRQFSDGGTIYGPDTDKKLKPPREKLTEQEQKLSKQNFDIMYVFLHLLNNWGQNPATQKISQWMYKLNADRKQKQLSVDRLPEDILLVSTGDLLTQCKLLIEKLENKEGTIMVSGDGSTGKMIVYYEATSVTDKDGESVKQVSIEDVKSLQKSLKSLNKITF